MPVGKWKTFKECVSANSDKKNPAAYCATIERNMNDQKLNFSRFIKISKIDPDKRLVFGYASTTDLDSQGEIVELEGMKKALPSYMKFPTIREMHQAKAVGKTETGVIDNKGLFIQAKIVADDAWKMVKEGVYKGFSIGGRIKQKMGNVIKDLDLTEISLVDVPANKAAVITLFKKDSNNKNIIKAGLYDFIASCNKIKGQYLFDKVMDGTQTEVKEEIKTVEVKTDVKEEVKPEVKEEPKVEEKPKEETKEEVKPEIKEEVKEEAKEEVKTEEKTEVEQKLDKLEKSMEKCKPKPKETLEKADLRIEKLETSLSKMADLIGRLNERLSIVEKTPAAPKTKANLTSGIADFSETSNESQLAKVEKRLEELRAIRETNLEKYQLDYQDEALGLMKSRDELKTKLGK